MWQRRLPAITGPQVPARLHAREWALTAVCVTQTVFLVDDFVVKIDFHHFGSL